jgi:arabinogalactan endo-1,4-beta-galactosidase
VPVYVSLSGRQSAARYARLSISSPDGSNACVGEFRLFGRDDATFGMALGADESFEHQELAVGNHFTDLDGRPATPMQILKAHGANYVRLRLWVAPPPGYSDLQSDLAMARRVSDAGMRLYLDIHYSDFWADPQHQVIPQAWQGQDLPTLAATVRTYTQQVIAAFAAQGTPVDLVSIGNEIRNGLLWPLGQVDWTADTGWSNLAALLQAGVAGARAGNPDRHRLQVMLHFDQGGDNADSREFFDNMVAERVPFDVIGLSYYHFFHGPLSAFRANVDDLAVRYGMDVFVAESQYPWTLANGDSTNNFLWNSSQLAPGYPADAGGQLSFYNDVLSILAQVPGGHGAGLFYWEPEWVPGVGWEPGAGSPNDNLTLFDFHGHALPSIAIFQSPPLTCARLEPSPRPCVV